MYNNIEKYKCYNRYAAEHPEKVVRVFTTLGGATGFHRIRKELLEEFIQDALGDNLYYGTVRLCIGIKGETCEKKVVYSSDRLRESDSFYGTESVFCDQYVPDDPPEDFVFEDFEKTSQIFVKECIVLLDGLTDGEVHNIACLHQHMNSLRGIEHLVLDPRDDFTVPELREMGISWKTIDSALVYTGKGKQS